MVVLMLVFIAMASCSRDSGGDYFFPISSQKNIEYSGLTSAAVIEEDNADTILEEAFMGSSAGTGMVPSFGSAAAVGSSAHSRPLALTLLKTFEGLAHEISALEQEGAPAEAGLAIPTGITVEGPCGGSCSVYFSISPITGISRTLIYNDYCSTGTTFNGTVSIQGDLDPDSDNLDLTLSFSSFSASYEGVSRTMSGTLELATSSDSSSLTMDILVKDNSTDKTLWMEDYEMDVTEHLDYDEITISGRFYEPDHGYVTLSTEDPLIIYYVNDYPSSGTLVAMGAEISEGNNTKARLVVLDEESYRIDVDEDGDGTYELSWEQNWED